MSVAVVNLGVGNTASVMFALERLGAKARLTANAREIEEADRVILPGVGAAAYAMRRMEEAGMREAIANFSRPLLGVCLGQQILFERSEEGEAPCLGVLQGKVTKLGCATDRPIPHMGWTRIAVANASPLLEGVKSGDYCYFVHSYACPLTDDTIATAEYGAPFAASVAHRNFYGCQFHPERSGETGRRILSNFLALPC